MEFVNITDPVVIKRIRENAEEIADGLTLFSSQGKHIVDCTRYWGEGEYFFEATLYRRKDGAENELYNVSEFKNIGNLLDDYTEVETIIFCNMAKMMVYINTVMLTWNA